MSDVPTGLVLSVVHNLPKVMLFRSFLDRLSGSSALHRNDRILCQECRLYRNHWMTLWLYYCTISSSAQFPFLTSLCVFIWRDVIWCVVHEVCIKVPFNFSDSDSVNNGCLSFSRSVFLSSRQACQDTQEGLC